MTDGVVIAGGGIAGVMAAIQCAEKNPSLPVTVMERGAGLLEHVRSWGLGTPVISTRREENMDSLIRHFPRGGQELVGPFARWMAEDPLEWFQSRGIDFRGDPMGEAGWKGPDARNVYRLLLEAAEKAGVQILLHTGLSNIQARREGGFWLLTREGEPFNCQRLLLSTGGIRYAHGGKMAAALGHTIIPAVPCLFTFRVRDSRIRSMAGCVVDRVRLNIPGFDEVAEGSLEITARGLGGSAVLQLSSILARPLADKKHRFKLSLNWFPAMKNRDLSRHLTEAKNQSSRRMVTENSPFSLPLDLWSRICASVGIQPGHHWGNVSRKQMDKLSFQIGCSTFEVAGISMNKGDYVTSGGG